MTALEFEAFEYEGSLFINPKFIIRKSHTLTTPSSAPTQQRPPLLSSSRCV